MTILTARKLSNLCRSHSQPHFPLQPLTIHSSCLDILGGFFVVNCEQLKKLLTFVSWVFGTVLGSQWCFLHDCESGLGSDGCAGGLPASVSFLNQPDVWWCVGQNLFYYSGPIPAYFTDTIKRYILRFVLIKLYCLNPFIITHLKLKPWSAFSAALLHLPAVGEPRRTDSMILPARTASANGRRLFVVGFALSWMTITKVLVWANNLFCFIHKFALSYLSLCC